MKEKKAAGFSQSFEEGSCNASVASIQQACRSSCKANSHARLLRFLCPQARTGVAERFGLPPGEHSELSEELAGLMRFNWLHGHSGTD